MYNFALAFAICAVVYAVGEIVSTKTKAWIPSVFVSAIVIMIGYWTVFPTTLVTDAALLPFASTIGAYLIVTHMGTTISIKQLISEWKTIAVCLAGLAGMCAICLGICPALIGRDYVIAGLPPLTGGIVAATTMMSAAQENGLESAALFAIAMYCVQGFAGYPLTAVCLQLEGKKRIAAYRAGEATTAQVAGTIDEVNGKLVTAEAEHKRLIPPVPAKYDSAAITFLKMAISAWLASMLGTVVIPGINMAISGMVWALILSILLTTVGFLDRDSLNKAKSYGIFMFALMMYVFDGLKDSTPSMFGSIIIPMLVLIVFGVAGMAVLVFIVSKILKRSFCLSLATALTALYGFPPNAIITENVCTAIAETPEEKEFLMGEMLTPMIVGGFTTVTITSVVIAGIFANMF